MSLLDTASLIVTPNGYKEGTLYSVVPSSGAGDLSVTRATTATRVNSAGLVELVPYNLVTWSEDFTSLDWVKNNTTITANSIISPDGNTNADTINLTNGSFCGLYKTGNGNVGIFTMSAFAKKGSKQWFYFVDLAGAGGVAWFDLNNGTIGNVINGTATIEDFGNGWFRCTYTNTSNITNAYFQLGFSEANNSVSITSSGNAYLYGTQLVEGSTAKDYQKTETRLNIPRLDYSNGSCPSIFVEPQRTNINANSQDYSANWFKQNITTTLGAEVSPMGLLNASSFNCTGNGAYMFQSIGVQNTITVTCFIKRNNSDWVFVGTNVSGVGDYGACFNVGNGTIGTIIGSGTTANIEDYGNGWYRCSITRNFSGANVLLVITPLSGDNNFANQNGKNYYIFGVQSEAGSYATSYIPTTSASVTRNADVISKTGISSLIGQTEGTFFMDLTFDTKNVNSAFPLYVGSSLGGYNFSTFIGFTTSGDVTVTIYRNTTLQVSLTASGYTENQRIKLGLGTKLNDFVLYIDGVLKDSSTSGNVSQNLTNIYLGYNPNAPGVFDYKGKVNALALWKTRLTNSQIAQLTTL